MQRGLHKVSTSGKPPGTSLTMLAARSHRGGSYAHYEFFCRTCQRTFSKILALVDYEKGGIICPRCGSHNVEQRWSAFSAITSKKSA